MNLLAEIIAFLILTLIGYSLGTLAEWIYNHIKEKWSKKYTPVMLSPGQILIPGKYADNYKEHIKLHIEAMKNRPKDHQEAMDAVKKAKTILKANDEQKSTRKARRVSKRTNSSLTKRTKKSKPNNSKSRKGPRLQSK